jgi:tetratricopeptide (TPR) repeat protein
VDFSARSWLNVVAMAEKSLRETPRDIRPLVTKGQDALSRDNFDYAIDLFTQVLARDPALFEVRKALREAQQGKAATGSSGFFKKMLTSAGSSPQIAKAQLALRSNPAEALAIVEQVLNGDAHNTLAHKIVVEAAIALQMPQTAVMSLEILQRAHPKDKGIAMQFANFLADTGDVKRGERILVELRTQLPNDPELAQALKNISARRTLDEGGYGALESGEGSYRDILRNETEAVALEQEQRVQKTEDVAERLIREYEAKLKIEPNNTKLLRSLAELSTQKKEFDRALDYYERLQAADGGTDSSVDEAIAKTQVRRFEHQIAQLDPTALDHAERAAQLAAEKLTYQLAECQKRVERYPTDLAFRYELGVLYFQAGKIGEAIAEFQKAQGNPNKRLAAMNHLAQCFARRKMNDLAAKTLQNAIKEKVGFDEEKKELIYNLGCVFEAMAKKQDAVEQFKLIYETDIGYKDVAAKVDAYYAGQ